MCFFFTPPLPPKGSFVGLETGSRKKHYCTLFSFLCNSLISISYLINVLLYYSASSAQRNSTRCAAFKGGGVCCSLEDPSRWSHVQSSVLKAAATLENIDINMQKVFFIAALHASETFILLWVGCLFKEICWGFLIVVYMCKLCR